MRLWPGKARPEPVAWFWRSRVPVRSGLASALWLLAALPALVPGVAWAQAAPVLLEVSGQVHQPLALTREQLLALKRKEYTESRSVQQDGKEVVLRIVFQGVPLRELLDRAGLKPDRREIRKAVVLLTAQDGYQTSFSWGELYNSQVGDGVVVVLRHGPDELLDTESFASLRSLQDLRPGPRHVRWLTRVEVLLPQGRTP